MSHLNRRNVIRGGLGTLGLLLMPGCSTTEIGMTEEDFPDCISSWWIDPVVSTSSDSAVFGTAGSDGVLAVHRTSAAGQDPASVRVSKSGVDDHNCPAVLSVPGFPIIAAYSFHNADRLLRIRVQAGVGDLSSVGFGAEMQREFSGTVSYAKLVTVASLRRGDELTVRAIVRVQNGSTSRSEYSWTSCSFTINRTNSEVVWSDETVEIVRATNGRVPYLSTGPIDGTSDLIRLGIGYHPNTPPEAAPLRFGFYDARNNICLNIEQEPLPMTDGKSSSNTDRDFGYVVPPAAQGFRRRFFSVGAGPAKPALLFAEWPQDNPDEGVYKVARQVHEGRDWVVSELAKAGPRFGHAESANYLPGASFMSYPRVAEDIYTVTGDGTVSTVRRHTPAAASWAQDKVYEEASILIRPVIFRVGGSTRIMFSRVSTYGSNAGGFAAFESEVVVRGI